MRFTFVASTFLVGVTLAISPTAPRGAIAQAGEPSAKEPAKTYRVTLAVTGMS